MKKRQLLLPPMLISATIVPLLVAACSQSLTENFSVYKNTKDVVVVFGTLNSKEFNKNIDIIKSDDNVTYLDATKFVSFAQFEYFDKIFDTIIKEIQGTDLVTSESFIDIGLVFENHKPLNIFILWNNTEHGVGRTVFKEMSKFELKARLWQSLQQYSMKYSDETTPPDVTNDFWTLYSKAQNFGNNPPKPPSVGDVDGSDYPWVVLPDVGTV